jgi:hypothetical protein
MLEVMPLLYFGVDGGKRRNTKHTRSAGTGQAREKYKVRAKISP